MTTATNRSPRRAGGLQHARGMITKHLACLSHTQWERLKELLSQLEKAQEEDERLEISQAIVEIVVPSSIGGIGDLETAVKPEARVKVEAYRKQVGEAIRRRREAMSMTQGQLAELAGIPQSHVSRLECGKHAPSHTTMKKIAKALQTRPSQLDPGFSDEPDLPGA